MKKIKSKIVILMAVSMLASCGSFTQTSSNNETSTNISSPSSSNDGTGKQLDTRFTEPTKTTIVFDLDGGESPNYVSSKEVSSLDSSDFFFDVTKEGYNFRGWSYNGTKVFDESGNKIEDVDMQTNMTFKALWSNTCKLSLKAEAMDGEASDIATLTGEGEYQFNTQVDISITSVSEGYSFVGWYDEATNSLISQSSEYRYMMWDDDVTLIAKFEHADYSLKIESNNFELGKVMLKNYSNANYYENIEMEIEYTEEVIIVANTLTDVRFLGWYDNSNNLVSTNAVYTFMMPNRDYILIAKWNSFSIEYDLNGGVLDEENPSTYHFGEAISLKSPSKEGYTFVGWKSGDKTIRNGEIMESTEDLKLTAEYEINNYTITLNPNNGEETTTQEVTFNSAYKLEEPKAPTGYVFEGWYNGNEKVLSEGTYNTTENMTLVARYLSYYNYVLNPDKVSYSISGIDKNLIPSTELVIPSSYNYLPVTGILKGAFTGCSSLTSITIPDSIMSIGLGAFWNCSSLTSISIPDSVTTIGSDAFYGCSSLVYNEYDNACYLGNGENPYAVLVKAKDTGITSLEINKGAKVICFNAFENCSSLTSITIPKGVTNIGGYTFNGCSSLASVTLPEGITTIGDSAFCGCSSLTSIAIPKSVTTIEDYAFYKCSALDSITIPESVEAIGKRAFNGCLSLTSIAISENVKSIGEAAFSQNTSLTSIMVDSNNPYFSSDDQGILYSKDKTELKCCPSGIKGEITIPDSATSIENYAFSHCSNLTSINIGRNIITIGTEAFSYCTSLSSITIPNGVTSIGDNAFYLCSSLTSFTVPESVTTIGSSAFFACSQLTWIIIGKSVSSIGRGALITSQLFTSIYYAGTKEQWESIDVGPYNTALTSATLYYYSEATPMESGYYWHYSNGVPTAW